MMFRRNINNKENNKNIWIYHNNFCIFVANIKFYWFMASTFDEYDINKNAVVFHYPHLSPYGPAYAGEKPIGCVVCYNGYFIRASIYETGFRVFKNSENLSKLFPTLLDAKAFVIFRVNKKRTLF